VLAGVDVPVGKTLTLGVEGNYHLGTNAIDSEYGVAARLGFPIGATSQLFVKGGYQWVDFDLGTVIGGLVPAGSDDTDGDYLVGVGGEFGIGDSPARIRVGVDTISFDTVRATAGVIFKF
jgi:outer membrane immunogenic protein